MRWVVWFLRYTYTTPDGAPVRGSRAVIGEWRFSRTFASESDARGYVRRRSPHYEISDRYAIQEECGPDFDRGQVAA